ncbi:DUF3152 domain-containing protein, partial [Actinosynnema sp. NPDC023658]|uniref:DUF3152 domain-containing protein n=1 Tax=Actinosynnema sp. NPDC023658 TaxID=3155465 RepID=UPI0033F1D291
MRPVPLVPYLAGVCLAATAVVALDIGTGAGTTVTWPASGVLPTPSPASVPAGALRSSGADLPPGPAFPEQGTGTWHVVPPPKPGNTPGTTYTVEVEDGVTLPQGDDSFAAVVDYALRHPRGWSTHHPFRRIGADAEPDLRIRLTSQATARSLCGFELPYDTSCRTGSTVHL